MEKNYSGLRDAQIAWYSLSAIRQTWLDGLEHQHGILRFRLHQIVQAARAKCFKPLGYCTVVNLIFTLRTENIAGCFRSFLSRFHPAMGIDMNQ